MIREIRLRQRRRIFSVLPILGCLLMSVANDSGLIGARAVWAGTTGKIAGKVVLAKTNEPLAGVNVVIVGTMMGAATDVQGDYFITNVPAGTFTVRASMIGYKNVVVTNVRVRLDATTELNISMEETVLELEEAVVVTAERPLVQKDNTSTRMILESEEIIARPTTEFTDVLTSLPSINVENGVMRVRGGTLDEVAFVIDGARARNPLDQTPYTSINLSSIQEMEVITGSFNAEYGEAQSGVINIITKEGAAKYQLFVDFRYMPSGKRHWGPALYDYSSDLYWENSHARHLQWWIDYPDQWVDPNGLPGNDPRSIWTAEEAYENYLVTHQPLTDYTETPTYQTEVSLGGPVPFTNKFYFFLTGKYRSQAPYSGNSYRKRGIFFNSNAKLTFQITPRTKLQFSGFYGTDKTSWGISDQLDYFYTSNFGITSRYAYYDYPGLPESQTDIQTLRFTNVLSPSTMYELKLSRVHAFRKVDVFPDDPLGWAASEATTFDNLRAVDSRGIPIVGANRNPIGWNTLGYYSRNRDNNTDWSLTGFFSSQVNKYWQLKSGLEFSYYNLDHFNESKIPARDDRTYNPYQGAVYFQNKLEFGGFIMNLGLRYDFYNPNDTVYATFDPMDSPKAKTEFFSQLSPRLGIAHLIDERTVLHFSYGHFFQRGTFGDYGEGFEADQQRGNLTTFVDDDGFPWTLGNRTAKPQKTVAFEVGIERNFADIFVLGMTGYYKDITNTVRGGIVVTDIQGRTYRTNGNADYRDVKGVELSLRKLPSGFFWGYVNFTTQVGIDGKSGDPRQIRETAKGVVYGYEQSGDRILHNNPRLKAGLFVETPHAWGFLNGWLEDILISLEFQAVYSNSKLRGDQLFLYDGTIFVRPADQNANLRATKTFAFLRNSVRLSTYIEVRNLLNDKWINLELIERQASPEDQRAFVDSDMERLPSVNKDGVPILDMAKYRNFPRSILFGVSLEL